MSRQAPYNHFADKEALLAELVRNGFERLGSAVGAVKESPDSLAKAAEAYIGFAQAAPALFRLMFSKELVDLSRFPEASAAAAAFGKLAAIVGTIAHEDDVPDLSLAAWCLVHGYATSSSRPVWRISTGERNVRASSLGSLRATRRTQELRKWTA